MNSLTKRDGATNIRSSLSRERGAARKTRNMSLTCDTSESSMADTVKEAVGLPRHSQEAKKIGANRTRQVRLREWKDTRATASKQPPMRGPVGRIGSHRLERDGNGRSRSA